MKIIPKKDIQTFREDIQGRNLPEHTSLLFSDSKDQHWKSEKNAHVLN